VTSRVGATARRGLRRVRRSLGDSPVFLPIVLRATPLGTTRRLTADTALVIEGMPRSGNTFARHAFDLAQPSPVVVSSHVHTPSAVVAAVRRNIPTLVLIRQPLDTVLSLIVAAPHVGFRAAIDEWIHHYEVLWPLRDQFVVATFDQVTDDFGAVTARVNERFGTAFACFAHDGASTQAVFASIEAEHLAVHGGTEHAVPRPSSQRRALRQELEERAADPGLSSSWERADAVWCRYRALAGTPG